MPSARANCTPASNVATLMHGARLDKASSLSCADQRRHAVVTQAAGVDRRRDEVVPQRVHLDQRRHLAGVAEVVARTAAGQ